MTDEEYERIKEDEKEHLRKMKALKDAARRLQRAKKTQGAAEGLNRVQDLLDESSTLAHRLDEEAAQGEARLDLALGADDETEDGSTDDAPDAETRARALVRRLRDEMNTQEDSLADAPDDDRPDKTIGRAP